MLCLVSGHGRGPGARSWQHVDRICPRITSPRKTASSNRERRWKSDLFGANTKHRRVEHHRPNRTSRAQSPALFNSFSECAAFHLSHSDLPPLAVLLLHFQLHRPSKLRSIPSADADHPERHRSHDSLPRSNPTVTWSKLRGLREAVRGQEANSQKNVQVLAERRQVEGLSGVEGPR